MASVDLSLASRCDNSSCSVVAVDWPSVAVPPCGNSIFNSNLENGEEEKQKFSVILCRNLTADRNTVKQVNFAASFSRGSEITANLVAP